MNKVNIYTVYRDVYYSLFFKNVKKNLYMNKNKLPIFKNQTEKLNFLRENSDEDDEIMVECFKKQAKGENNKALITSLNMEEISSPPHRQ